MAIATVENIPGVIIEKYGNKIDFNILMYYFENKFTENGFTKEFENNFLVNEKDKTNISSGSFNDVEDFLFDLKK